MKRRKKFHIIIPALLLLAVCVGILYLRALEFTVSARTLLVEEISRATSKKAFAGSIRFDLFKGLLLDGVVIYDSSRVIARARSVSCGLLIPSLISKKVIIPAIKIESPVVNVERGPDGSINVFELIPRNYVSKSGMAVSVHKVVIRDGLIDIIDKTLDPAFKKRFINFNAEAKLYLPIRAIFRARFDALAATTAEISGEYIFPTDTLTADMISENLSLKDFDQYYRASGLSFPSGALRIKAKLTAKAGVLVSDIDSETKNLTVLKEDLKARIDCAIKARLRYLFKEKDLTYSGYADIKNMDIDEVEGMGRLENIRARVDFDQTRLSSADIKAESLGMIWDAKINIVNFAKPIIDIYAHAGVHLGALQEKLKSGFGINFPNEVAGKGDIRLSIQMEQAKPAKINGYISFNDATASLGKGNFPIENIKGEIRFGPGELAWQDLRCAYRGVDYTVSGKLAGFDAPRIRLEVASRDLVYTSSFVINDNLITLSKLDGHYMNSKFSATGDIDVADPATVDAQLKGTLSLDLADLRRISRNAAGIRKMRPAGKVAAEFELSGDINDLRTCYVNAKMKTKEMSAYGLKFTDATLAFVQEQGVGNVKSMRSSFYGGTISVMARIDWLAKGLPYSANIDAIGVRLDSMKADTDFKDKDVSGDIKVYADIKGIFKDPSRLTSIGHIGLTKGRLWQLDLFKGAGTLIFSKDFSDIVFTSGACDYKVKGDACFIDNLIMTSDVLTLYGSGRIGFDRSVEGTLRPEISEYIADKGTLASAVGEGTVIEVSGTLKDPRFKTNTSVASVVGAMLQKK